MPGYIPEVKIKHSQGDSKFIMILCDETERGRIRKADGQFEVIHNNGEHKFFDNLEKAFCWLVPNFCNSVL